ncbi:acyl-CoA dehydrogenase family protein [Cohnella zeiphila]|uniref:Acyl-CoA/acyl-ACP dehydrogenase n=1 Tax=Cohnella zeiphila TaxID=2761120 RepID=A0A7X0W103_9BACL|nr:acyl-CoA dehydrogenase family protein [Cohnella zeiphila]MBB6735578.1 acyl-CoA/acyl-ACP dehydrogenase [Cohnella zeiphila]
MPDILELTKRIANETVAPLAAEIDRERRFPREGIEALGRAGLLGLLVPEQAGGLGGTVADLAAVTEVLAEACGSTAMCFLMHCCATAVVSAKATPEQQERYLRPIARGEKLGTLAFSETGTGAHFYSPEISAVHDNGEFVLNGRKSFVTNGDKADFLIVVTNASSPELGLDMLIVDAGSPGARFDGVWEGIGLSGNNSISLRLDNVRVPQTALVGAEGDGMGLIFQVVAPTFILGVSGVNAGLARGAYRQALGHAQARKYADGRSLAEIQAIQFYLSDMFGAVESASLFVRNAAAKAVRGDEDAVLHVMQSKVIASEQAIRVTNLAMQVCGGQGYTRSLPVERYLRDARAGAVMAPTTEVLKEWVGKSVAGVPLF